MCILTAPSSHNYPSGKLHFPSGNLPGLCFVEIYEMRYLLDSNDINKYHHFSDKHRTKASGNPYFCFWAHNNH